MVLPLQVCAKSGADAPPGSAVLIDNLTRLSVGVSYENGERDWQVPGGIETFKTRGWYGIASFDIVSFLTVNGGAGKSETKIGQGMPYGDEDSLWTAGVTLNVWEHPIDLPLWMASTLRMQVAYSYWEGETGLDGDTLEWNENRTALIFSSEFLRPVEIESALNIPYSTVFSIGPVWSSLEGDDDSGEATLEADDDFGLLLGLDLKLAQNLSLGWEGRMFDDNNLTHSANLVFRF